MELTPEEQQHLGFEVGRAFSPAAPINEADLFAGRIDQLRRVIDAIAQRGQHVIIFGERGVGKTSLANVLSAFLEKPNMPFPILAPKVNCDGQDTYSSLWRKVFSQIDIAREVRRIGFTVDPGVEHQRISDSLPDDISPDLVREHLSVLGARVLLIVIIDEYDRLPNGQTGRLFADTIKMLSDYSVPATLVLVGVANTVDELIAEHQSIERALVQVPMPRMSPKELHEIVNKGLSKVQMDIQAEALDHIALLSRGLPHYTHLLGLHSARMAIDNGSRHVGLSYVDGAIKRAIEGAQQSIISAYHRATMSPRRENLYAQVLLACALAECDELGYFAPSDVRRPMSAIMRKRYDIPNFARHLADFCSPGRGPILEKTGARHRFRFRFINPLMQPFVIMKGLDCGMVDRTALNRSIHQLVASK
ncbi:MAG: AAA family ATPase [Nitrososphaerales archaeon]